MKIFLTGGTGFIGRPLTRCLIDRGWEVNVLVRKPESVDSKEIQSIGAILIPGDVTMKESMRNGMQGADVVIHNAGWYKFGICKKDHETMDKINIIGTQNTLELAIELGIKKIIYTSSILAFGRTGDIIADEQYVRQYPPLTYYEESKMRAHAFANELQKLGAPIIITCPAGVIGPGDHSGIGYLARMYVHHCLPPILWTPNGKLAHVYVDDAAESIARCVEYGKLGEIYILNNGNQTHREMSEDWKKCKGGCKKTWFWLPDSISVFLNTVAEPIQRFLGLPIVFCREFILSAKENWQFTAAKAERDLNMQFRSLEQAWCDTIEGERKISELRKKTKRK